MVFSGITFLFYFLPILLFVYFFTPNKLKNVVLLAASLLFYTWGEGYFVLLMVLSICMNYVFGYLIAQKLSKAILLLAVGLNLSLLVLFKYAEFILHNISAALIFVGLSPLSVPSIHLPLGISFFTFQAISYLIDIYRKEIPYQKNVLNLGLYISLFPQLIAGPIVRYKDVMQDIKVRTFSSTLFASGVERFVIGLGKKMLIANPLGLVVDNIFSVPFESLPTHIAWLGVLLYALQIYFDFSGYSDMAIGLGRIFGFRFLENFRYPYAATSIQDFWRRWHISLSTWFRDYLYIPLGGNRVGNVRVYFNLVLVFFVCGLWHGASWNFIVWGLFHGFFLSIERMGVSNILASSHRAIQHVYVWIVVLVSWVFFRAETLPDALNYLHVMFAFNFGDVPFEITDSLNMRVILALLIGLLISVPTLSSIRNNSIFTQLQLGDAAKRANLVFTIKVLGLFTILFLSCVNMASSTHNPFIYFRF
ncbi:MAG TPA: MBOAT family protein [Gammaproteobacteria bacterium]|nr:MBOAT family protein [Gammaproteobacteria bacterium]